MQADSSLEESKTVSEPPKSRPDYTLAVRRRELRFKNHHPDPRTSRYGQRLVEEILGCRMSGWLTPKLECNKKLQAIPPPGPRDSEGAYAQSFQVSRSKIASFRYDRDERADGLRAKSFILNAL